MLLQNGEQILAVIETISYSNVSLRLTQLQNEYSMQ